MNAKESEPITTLKSEDVLIQRLSEAFSARKALLEPEHNQALRLFNGFYEGFPDLVVDLFGQTLLISNHAKPPDALDNYLPSIFDFYRRNLSWLSCGLLKHRNATDLALRRGIIVFGSRPDNAIIENGVTYALNLTLNQDSSLYLDTRHLRAYLTQNMAHKSLLNCFAYTGTLGIGALAGGARYVVQTDLNKSALALAQQSAQLNHFPGRMETLPMDFFKAVAYFKQQQTLFDCVILDPPLYSSTPQGTVDLLHNWLRLINKVRPLIAHNGLLIAINNALYLPGSEVIQTIESLQNTGYVQFEQIISVPEDITGFPQTIYSQPPVDPTPFNHPTKIVVLHILRKDSAKATL